MKVQILQRCTGSLLFLLTITGITGTTDIFENLFMKSMVLSNASSTWDWWVSPPVQPSISIYIFNYTNSGRCLEVSSASNSAVCTKFAVHTVGPYVYREKTEKVGITFNDDDTISFREKKSYEWIPEESVGHPQEDIVVVPNIPYFAAVKTIGQMNQWNRLISRAALVNSNSDPFVQLSPHDLLWGYSDPMFHLGKLINSIPYEKFGLMVPKVNVSEDEITVHTGAHNISKLGSIVRYNGDSSVDYWGSKECNQIEGSDGTQFPPTLMYPGARLTIYNHDICRRLPFDYVSEGEAQGLPSYRFQMPKNVFDDPESNPENACFCNKDSYPYYEQERECLPSGVTDSSPCSFGAPILMSFPNFYLGDSSLREPFDGLDEPDAEKHDSYLDLHQKFALFLGGHSRFQVNVQVQKGDIEIGEITNNWDKTIFPVAWFDMTVGEYPTEVTSLLRHATNMINRVAGQAGESPEARNFPPSQHGIPVQGQIREEMLAALAGWEAERVKLLQALSTAERNIDGINIVLGNALHYLRHI